MSAKVVHFQLTKPRALEIVRAAAQNTSRITWLPHVQKRMRQRRITATQVLSCLRQGVIIEGPAPNIKGGWQCTLRWLAAGDEVTVGVVIESSTSVLVLTVFK